MGKCAIIPEPKSVRDNGEAWFLKDKAISIVCDRHNPDVVKMVSLLSDDFRSDWQIRLQISGRCGYSLQMSILETRDDVLGDEGYLLETNADFARVFANTPKGLFNGGQTFRQLITKNKNALFIRNCRIKDYPDFAVRGIHIDLKAQMLCFGYIKNIFRECAKYKLNAVLLEYEDKFPYKKHKRIVSPLAFTSDEIDELTAYAHMFGIQIIPKVQGLAHVEYILKHEKYFSLREHPDSPTDFCPSNRDYFGFISEVYSEVIKKHKNSKYFHAGCDESLLFGTCSHCDDKIKKKDRETFFAEVVNRIHGLVKGYGKKTIMWGDHRFLYPRISETLDKDILMMPWKYHDYCNRQDYSFIDYLVENELDVIICPAARMSLDTSIFPDCFDRNRNTVNFIKYVHKKHHGRILGVINSSWVTSRVPFETGWFGFMCSAEYGWSSRKTNYRQFEKKFLDNYYGITRPNFIKVFYSLKGDRVWNEMLSKDSYFKKNLRICNQRMKLAESALAEINAAEPLVVRHVYNFQYLKLSAIVTLHRQKRLKLLVSAKKQCARLAEPKGNLTVKIKKLRVLVKDFVTLKNELEQIVRETKRLNKSMFKAEEVTKDIIIRYDDEKKVLTNNIRLLNSTIKKAEAEREFLPLVGIKTDVNDIEYRYYHKPQALSPYDDSWNLNL